jgi:hypothetical protein
VLFNSEIADEWVPPVRRRTPRRARLAARHCHVATTCQRRSRALRPLSGPRVARPVRLAPPAHSTASHRTPLASPLVTPSRPLWSKATDAGPSSCRLAARPSPSCRVVVPAPVSRPVPRPSPVRRLVPPCSTAAVPRHRRALRCCAHRSLRGPAELGRARCAGRGQARSSPRGRGSRTRAAPAP